MIKGNLPRPTRASLFAVAIMSGISLWGAQSARTPATGRTQILMPVSLTSALDSRKLKPGDEVDLKTIASLDLQNGSVIPKGAKVIGHVTESKARSKGDSESSLGIVFDKISWANGETLAVSGVMRAVGPNPKLDAGQNDGVGYSDLPQAIAHNANMGTYAASVQVLNEQSVGVVGIKNLTLNKDGVLKSDGKMVKLDLGSQVLFQAQLTKK